MKTLKSLIVCLIVILGMSSVATAAPLSQVPITILYVKQGGTGDCLDWDAACDLQTALSIASSGDQVWVAAGSYQPTTTDPDPRKATFELKSGVAIYGGFPALGGTWEQRDWVANLTILSGDIGIVVDSTDNSYHVVSGNGVDGTAILDGFTISGGNANGGDPHYYGGGMYNNSSSPTLTNVTFTENSAGRGGGMYNYSSSPMLTNVTFTENLATTAGGGMWNWSSNPTLTNVTFTGNITPQYGGGMYNYSSNPTLTNVTFSDNPATVGGGMSNEYNSSPTLTNVTFSANPATIYGGGMHNDSSSPILNNVTFSGNSAINGGGMYNWGSNPTLTNVTFTENLATIYGGGGMYNYSSSPMLTNAIVWGNTPDQIYNDTSAPIITYSDIQGCGGSDAWDTTCGTDLGGNIDSDPLLGPLADNGGFTLTRALANDSPAIDAGDPNNCPSSDQRGFYRPIDGNKDGTARCDMGAYEFGSISLYLPLIIR